jgi:hypothetical protein
MVYIGWATHALQGDKTKGGDVAILSKSPKISGYGSIIATHCREGEIVSNRKSTCYGEVKPSSAHTAHHARRVAGA